MSTCPNYFIASGIFVFVIGLGHPGDLSSLDLNKQNNTRENVLDAGVGNDQTYNEIRTILKNTIFVMPTR